MVKFTGIDFPTGNKFHLGKFKGPVTRNHLDDRLAPIPQKVDPLHDLKDTFSTDEHRPTNPLIPLSATLDVSTDFNPHAMQRLETNKTSLATPTSSVALEIPHDHAAIIIWNKERQTAAVRVINLRPALSSTNDPAASTDWKSATHQAIGNMLRQMETTGNLHHIGLGKTGQVVDSFARLQTMVIAGPMGQTVMDRARDVAEHQLSQHELPATTAIDVAGRPTNLDDQESRTRRPVLETNANIFVVNAKDATIQRLTSLPKPEEVQVQEQPTATEVVPITSYSAITRDIKTALPVPKDMQPELALDTPYASSADNSPLFATPIPEKCIGVFMWDAATQKAVTMVIDTRGKLPFHFATLIEHTMFQSLAAGDPRLAVSKGKVSRETHARIQTYVVGGKGTSTIPGIVSHDYPIQLGLQPGGYELHDGSNQMPFVGFDATTGTLVNLVGEPPIFPELTPAPQPREEGAEKGGWAKLDATLRRQA